MRPYRGIRIEKDKNSGEFVFGAAWKDEDRNKTYIIPKQTVSHYASAACRASVFIIEVHPDSVSQYVEYIEYEGDLWEGDIIKAEYTCLCATHTITGFISYDNASAAWYLETESESTALVDLDKILEVIGNIHEESE